jgi:hypothetical protein
MIKHDGQRHGQAHEMLPGFAAGAAISIMSSTQLTSWVEAG